MATELAPAPPPPPLDSARHPFELFVLFLGLVVGAPLLFGAPTPGSTTEALGPVLVRIWAWLLVGGCLLALTGAWWTWWAWLGRWMPHWRPSVLSGLLIEQVGLIATGVGTLVYTVGVFDAGGRRAAITAALLGGWGLACFWRARQIRRWVRATERAQNDG